MAKQNASQKGGDGVNCFVELEQRVWWDSRLAVGS